MATTFIEPITETFHVISCYSCSIRFAITAGLYRRVVTDAIDSVYCPACGHLTCWRESDAQKKIKELEKKLAWEASQSALQKTLKDAAEASLLKAELEAAIAYDKAASLAFSDFATTNF